MFRITVVEHESIDIIVGVELTLESFGERGNGDKVTGLLWLKWRSSFKNRNGHLLEPDPSWLKSMLRDKLSGGEMRALS